MYLSIPYEATVHFEGTAWTTKFNGKYESVESFDSEIDITDITNRTT